MPTVTSTTPLPMGQRWDREPEVYAVTIRAPYLPLRGRAEEDSVLELIARAADVGLQLEYRYAASLMMYTPGRMTAEYDAAGMQYLLHWRGNRADLDVQVLLNILRDNGIAVSRAANGGYVQSPVRPPSQSDQLPSGGVFHGRLSLSESFRGANGWSVAPADVAALHSGLYYTPDALTANGPISQPIVVETARAGAQAPRARRLRIRREDNES